jgi:hypothetical protein
MSELGNVVQLVNRLQGACTLLGVIRASRPCSLLQRA